MPCCGQQASLGVPRRASLAARRRRVMASRQASRQVRGCHRQRCKNSMHQPVCGCFALQCDMRAHAGARDLALAHITAGILASSSHRGGFGSAAGPPQVPRWCAAPRTKMSTCWEPLAAWTTAHTWHLQAAWLQVSGLRTRRSPRRHWRLVSPWRCCAGAHVWSTVHPSHACVHVQL